MHKGLILFVLLCSLCSAEPIQQDYKLEQQEQQSRSNLQTTSTATTRGKDQSMATGSSLTTSEYYLYGLVIIYFLVDLLRSHSQTLIVDKWRNILSVFPTYQMWRGAYSDQDLATLDICSAVSIGRRSGSLDDGSFSEYDLQQCYQQMKARVDEDSTTTLVRGLIADGFQIIIKLAAIGMMVTHSLSMLNMIPRFVDVDPTNHNHDSLCFRQLDLTYFSKKCDELPGIDQPIFTTLVTDTWSSCISLCIKDEICWKTGLLAYNYKSKTCQYGIRQLTCEPDQSFTYFQRVPCPDRTANSCGELYTTERGNGAFENGDTSLNNQCEYNRMGAVCNVQCAPNYTVDDAWGDTAVCGTTAFGNLRWMPYITTNFSNPGQDMCTPDLIHRTPNLLFHLTSRDFFSGSITSLQSESTPPVWGDPQNTEMSFSIQWENGRPSSLGPEIDPSHLLINTPSLKFIDIPSASGSWLSSLLNYDYLRNSKALTLFAVIDPLNIDDWLHFTSIIQLDFQGLMASESIRSGPAFVRMFPDVFRTNQWSVVTVSTTRISGTHVRNILRVNGFMVHSSITPDTVQSIECSKFMAPQCVDIALPLTPATEWSPSCAPSTTMCGVSILHHIISSNDHTPPPAYIGRGYRSDLGQYKQYQGWIAEMVLFDREFDVFTDSTDELRRIEDIEWMLATKYNLRSVFFPAKPPAPTLRDRGHDFITASFPAQALWFENAVTFHLEVFEDNILRDRINIPIGSTQAYIPSVQPLKSYKARLAVSRENRVLNGFFSRPFVRQITIT